MSTAGQNVCRIYPVIIGGKRIEVRVHGLLAMTPASQKALQELVAAVAKLKHLDVSCQVVDPDVPQKVQP